MNKEILDKNIVIENNLVIITENVKTTMDINQLESKSRDIKMQKMRLQEQNLRLVNEYNRLVAEESEINNLITQLSANDGMDVI